MFGTVIRKCTNCHHEDESSSINSQEVCSWCRQGTMQIIHKNKDVDIYGLLDKMKK